MSEVQELMQRMGYKPLPASESPEVNEAANKGRAYDHLHDGLPVSLPQYSDREIGNLVRMLMRDDWNHETVVVAARDRIFCLEKEKDALRGRVQELEAACAKVLDAYLRVDQPAHDGEADLCSAVLDMREVLKCAPSAAPVD